MWPPIPPKIHPFFQTAGANPSRRHNASLPRLNYRSIVIGIVWEHPIIPLCFVLCGGFGVALGLLLTQLTGFELVGVFVGVAVGLVGFKQVHLVFLRKHYRDVLLGQVAGVGDTADS